MSFRLLARTVCALGAVAAIGIGAWLWLDQPPAPGSRFNLDPPVLKDRADVDPAVAALIDSALKEVKAAAGSPDARAKLGMVYHANGLHALAQTAYEQAIALQHDNDNPRLHYYLAHALAEQGDPSAALQAMDRAIEAAPAQDYPPAHWHRGSWLLDLGRVDEAEQAFKRVSELRAGDVSALVGLARVHLERREYDKANALLRGIVATHGPTTPNRAYIMQLLATAQRNTQGAAQPAARGAGSGAGVGGRPPHWPDPWMEDLLAHRTGYPAALEELEHLVASGQWDRAIAAAAEILKSHPRDVVVMNWHAVALVSRGQLDQGMALLLEALKIDANYATTHQNLAHCYEVQGQHDRALEHARRAVQLNPGSGQASLILGQILLGAGQWNEAAQALEQAVRLSPDSADALATLALACAEAGRVAEGRETLERAMLINPRAPLVQRAAARMAQIDSQSGRNQAPRP